MSRQRRGGRRHGGKPKDSKKEYRRNEQIRIPEIFLIDELNNQVGITPTNQAMEMARAAGLDLVEVAPLADPPVCKIVDFGKLQYELEKQARKNRAGSKAGGETKGIRLSVSLGEHDMLTRVKSGQKFLDKKNKLLIEIRLRGREKAHPELGEQMIKKYIELLEREILIEQPVKRLGGRLTSLVSMKK